MIKSLRNFTSETLFSATSKLLTRLHIQFDRETAEAIDVADLYDQPMPKYLTDALACIKSTYFIGIINDGSLRGAKSEDTLDEVAETLAHGGKYDGMFVFACDAKPEANLTRTSATALTRAFNRIASANPVILFIRQGNMLSMATCERMEYSQEWRRGMGEKIGKVNILRNINCQNPHRGHYDILESLGDKSYPTFEELYKHWLEVFSSELLTKKFYNELSDWYAWAVMVAKFPNDLRTTDDDEKYNHESCIRLITRLIFVWFLKQKHLIPDEFFEEKYIRDNFIENFDPHDRRSLLYDAEKSRYYRAILQNLFFATLNCPIVAEGNKTPCNRRFRKATTFHGKNTDYNVNNLMRYESDFMEGGAAKFLKMANNNVPFLNGGLFDCLDDKVRKLYYDGFSEHPDSLAQLYLPDWLFFGEEVGAGIDLSQWYGDAKKKSVSARGIIDILKRYSFTIEENTPYDQEVSLDPELLGKVFENLLAAYNPETKTSARKQTGSFYTPREIVQYMVNESLVAHLKRICGDAAEAKYRALLDYASADVELSRDQRKSIMHALYNCRVLDPACGSGAFPMGILQQMVHVLKRIDPSNDMWKDLMIDQAIAQTKVAFSKDKEDERKARLEDIEEAFNTSLNDPDYARKLYLIEHCIYGVDIQPIATQISKLRFFISLVADQKPTKDNCMNFGIRPLPNLESKFVAANTLIPLDRDRNLFTASEEILEFEQQLQDINHRIFLAKRSSVKEKLRAEMLEVRNFMAHTLESLEAIGPDGYMQLTNWNMFDQNASAPFFDPEWMFGVKEGFDVVIGNPPYVQLQANKGELAKLYEPYGYKSFKSSADIFCLFYEMGNKNLTEGGYLCYITSNKWMRAGYGDKLRKYLTTETNPTLLIDFGETHVFESATVMTNILIFQKEANQHNLYSTQIKEDFTNPKFIAEYVDDHNMICKFMGDESWVIMSDFMRGIKRKCEAQGKELTKWDIEIYRGILTGYNPAFYITTEQRNEILASCGTEEERRMTDEIIRPMLRGKDIRKYGCEWADLWLIGTFPAKNIDVEKLPAIKNHLLSFTKERLEQTGATHIINGEKVKSRKKTSGKWFETQDSIKYWKGFYSNKIIYPNMTKYMPFYYDEQNYLTNQKCFIISGEHMSFLTAFFNSSLFKFCFFDNFPVLFGGSRELSKIFFDKIPVLEVDDDTDAEFRELVLDIQNKYSDDKAKAIDQKIFDLYGLTSEERDAVGYIDFHNTGNDEDEDD